MQSVAPPQALKFDLENVRLLDGPFKKAQELDRQYLLSLDPDRFLHMFRVTAGLPSSAEPLGGWESPTCEIRGHSLGHYLSACALMFAATGDAALKAKTDVIVAGLAECQKAAPERGFNPGYCFAFPEEFFDRVDACKPVWVPWYTAHKIMAGLLDVRQHCANAEAMDVLLKMAEWTDFRTGRLSHEHMQRTLELEFGGMNEVMANLYAETEDPKHLEVARRFDHERFFAPLAEGRDELTRMHCNTQIPKVLGAAREYETSGEKRYGDIARFFWERVALHRSYATGGTSNFEHWRAEPDVLSTETSVESQESCCTYNMLALTDHLFQWKPEPRLADFYERALINGILATQHPENGMMMYYVSMEPGHWKVFNTPCDSFWCCTGTGMENHAKYGEAVYYRGEDGGLWVNQFIASELKWAERGVTIRQVTRFPEEESVRLEIEAETPTEMNVRIRVPWWATEGVRVVVDGEPVEIDAEPGSFFTLSRTWTRNVVELDMPMLLHLAPTPDDPDCAAIMYGPIVLAAELGTEDFTPDMQYHENQRHWHHAKRLKTIPRLVVESRNPNAWLHPVEGRSLAFRTAGAGRPHDVTLAPLHQIHDQRYMVYFHLHDEAGYAEHVEREKARTAAERAEQEDYAARLIEAVEPGLEANEFAHGLQCDEGSRSGRAHGKTWRDAVAGGFFEYELPVAREGETSVRCLYWGGDGGRNFQILVDGEAIALETLEGNQGERFFAKEHPVPPELTAGKRTIRVRFQAHAGNVAGGVFGVATMRAK